METAMVYAKSKVAHAHKTWARRKVISHIPILHIAKVFAFLRLHKTITDTRQSPNWAAQRPWTRNFMPARQWTKSLRLFEKVSYSAAQLTNCRTFITVITRLKMRDILNHLNSVPTCTRCVSILRIRNIFRSTHRFASRCPPSRFPNHSTDAVVIRV
jgi:hypothetical protein